MAVLINVRSENIPESARPADCGPTFIPTLKVVCHPLISHSVTPPHQQREAVAGHGAGARVTHLTAAPQIALSVADC